MMIRSLFLSAAFAALIALPVLPVRAQDAAAAQPPDHAQRLELSQKLHEIRPATLQVESALTNVAQRLPETERKAFIDRMMGAIDAKKLGEVSVNAMATVFTLPELQRMYEYFSTPEARGISDKMPIYQNMIQPEIVKMLDKAMMEMRTGAAPAAPAAVSPAAPAAEAPAAVAPQSGTEAPAPAPEVSVKPAPAPAETPAAETPPAAPETDGR